MPTTTQRPVGTFKRVMRIKNCMDCPFASIERDPDPDDWFNDDDMKVVCQKTDKTITLACRPYNLRKECQVPTWCPLPKEK